MGADDDNRLDDPRGTFERLISARKARSRKAADPKPQADDSRLPLPVGPRDEGEPHYHGHRERLRERFLRAGAEALQDYELMELVLFRAIPRRDVKPLAKEVVARFGSFAEAISADVERLRDVPGLGEAAIAEFKVVQAAALKLAQGRVIGAPALGSWNQLVAYCRSVMGFEKNEQFRVLFLDNRNRLIADEVQQRGTVNHTQAYPREIVKRALELSASAIILVHNHPSGDATPSAADIRMTKEIVDAAKALKIEVHDHLVIGAGEPASFKSLGLI